MKSAAGFILAVLVGLTACGDRDLERQQNLEAGARKQLDSMSKDPLATQLRQIHLGKKGGICGVVNLKNDEGQYRGFVPFYSKADSEPILIQPAVLHVKGYEEAIASCLSPADKKTYEGKEREFLAEWQEKMDRKYEKAHLQYLKAQLRCEELGMDNCR